MITEKQKGRSPYQITAAICAFVMSCNLCCVSVDVFCVCVPVWKLRKSKAHKPKMFITTCTPNIAHKPKIWARKSSLPTTSNNSLPQAAVNISIFYVANFSSENYVFCIVSQKLLVHATHFIVVLNLFFFLHGSVSNECRSSNLRHFFGLCSFPTVN